MTLQYHLRRNEHWFVVSGIALAHIDGIETELKTGQSIDIKKENVHCLSNIGNEDLIIIEIQTGDYFEEDDIIRLDDPYGRK